MADPFTAAELRAIGERIKRDRLRPVNVNVEAEVDRARLYAALERIIVRCVVKSRHRSHFSLFLDSLDEHPTKDAAIDALLQGGWESDSIDS